MNDSHGVHFDLVHGPIDDDRLAAIARLYGAFNARYADVEHCRGVFNENPMGPTLHGFAIGENGSVVAHYALLAMPIVADGRRVEAAKGEAFVVDARHRHEVVNVPGRGVLPLAFALPIALYRFVEQKGIELVHMVADPEVGTIHRLAGCHALARTVRRSRLVLRPRRLGRPKGGARKRVVQVGAGFLQRLWFETTSALLSFTRGRTERISGPALTPETTARLAAELPQIPGWTLAVEPPLLEWMARLGDLTLVNLEGKREDYALVCPRAGDGGTLEIVLWKQGGGLLEAIRLLDATARLGRDAGCVQVAFVEQAAWSEAARRRLRVAGKFLGFHEREEASNFLVYSKTPEFLDPNRLWPTPLFRAIF